jgi:hypothetical protein
MRYGYALALLSLSLCAMNASAMAQKHWQVDVPFDFSANGESFPAGDYDISLNPDSWVLIVSNHRDATKHLQWIAVPSGVDRTKPTLRFNEVDSQYTLNSVLVDHWESPTRPKPRGKTLQVSIDSNSP